MTQGEEVELANILDVLSFYLETEIECNSVDGKPGKFYRQVMHCKRLWRRVEDWKIRLLDGLECSSCVAKSELLRLNQLDTERLRDALKAIEREALPCGEDFGNSTIAKMARAALEGR